MSNLLIDFFNVYIKIKSKGGNVIPNFFRYVNTLQNKYHQKNVYYIFDGSKYFKKTIDSNYKSKRKPVSKSIDTQIIKNILINLPKTFIVIGEYLEADDMAFNLCRELNNCVCVSEDYHWLRNLTANDNIKIYRKGHILHSLSFEQKMHYPVEKIPLFLFLSGDCKDGVKKPFRIKGSILENISNYSDIKDYCDCNDLGSPEVEKYKTLINPVTHIRFKVIPGTKTEVTSKIISKCLLLS